LHIEHHVTFYNVLCISGTSQYVCVREQKESGITLSPFVTVIPDHILYLASGQTLYQ